MFAKKKLKTDIYRKKTATVPEGWECLCDVRWLEGAPTPTLLLCGVSRVVFLQLLAKAARWADTMRNVPEEKILSSRIIRTTDIIVNHI
jgi:hypothetical protein